MMVSMWAEPVFVTYLLISFWVGYSFALGGYLYSIPLFLFVVRLLPLAPTNLQSMPILPTTMQQADLIIPTKPHRCRSCKSENIKHSQEPWTPAQNPRNLPQARVKKKYIYIIMSTRCFSQKKTLGMWGTQDPRYNLIRALPEK